MILRRDFLAGVAGAAASAALGRKLKALPPADEAAATELARKLASDPLRPQYHLLPAANWMNDPNGPIYWKDRYHMFYQYNPNGAFWGDMHWGHAVSQDMIHWRHLPVALAPTPGSPDAEGCFTGTAVVQDGQVVVLYTGVRKAPREKATIQDGDPPLLETQCLATAADAELRNWTKLPEPVLPSPPPGMEVNGFRDPSPWRKGDWWYMVTATGIAGKGGAVLLYRSRDLRAWEFLHILSRRDGNGANPSDPFDPWEVWECPEFFALGDKHVLIFSTAGRGYWQSGVLDERTMAFHPERAGILDYGSFYAPKTQLDKAGNRILWGWITESRKVEQYKAAGWAGMMSLPRLLSLGRDGRLRMSVAEEVKQLRGREQRLEISGDQAKIRARIESMRIEACCGELLCTVRRTAEPFALLVCGNREEQTPWLKLSYDPARRGMFWIDDRPLELFAEASEPEDGDIEVRCFVDGSAIEVFVNSRIAWTKRFYYEGKPPQDLCMRWTGTTAGLVNLTAWQLSPISADRLTT